MAKVLVLYYSMYGHIETMAHAVAEGANKVDGAEVIIKRVPETMQPEIFLKAGGKTQNAPVATPQELADYDAIILVPHALWQYVRSDAHLPRSDWRAVGLWCSVRQTRQRIQFNGNRRRSGTNHYLSTDYACPPWDGDCAYRLRGARAV